MKKYKNNHNKKTTNENNLPTLNPFALKVIKEADEKGYVIVTGKTQKETKENILNFFKLL